MNVPFRFLCYLLALAAAGGFGLVVWKKLTVNFRLLTIMIVCTFVSEAWSRVFVALYRNSSPGYHVLHIIQFLCLTQIYKNLFVNERLKKAIIVLMIVVPILSVLNTVFLQSIWMFPSNILVVEVFVFVICSLVLFWQMLANVSATSIFKQDVFWFNTGVLVYFSASFLSWATHNFMFGKHILGDFVAVFSYITSYCFYFMMALAIFMNSKAKPGNG